MPFKRAIGFVVSAIVILVVGSVWFHPIAMEAMANSSFEAVHELVALDDNVENFLPAILGGKGVTDLPTAIDDSYQIPQDTQLVVGAANGVLANDDIPGGGSPEAELESDVENGVLNLNPDGSFDYTPETGFSGTDTFTYHAVASQGTSNIATVTIDVLGAGGVNTAPYMVTGDLAFRKQVVATKVAGTHSFVGGDFDRDGDMDGAATGYIDGLVYWYENDGQGNFESHLLDPDIEGAYPAGVGDVDGDGYDDILVGAYLSDTYVWYRNDGGGDFTRNIVDDTADGAHSIITVDMNNDGDVDFVIANQDGNTVGWYENDGSNQFTFHVIDDTATDAKRSQVADIDGDGDLDLVVAIFRLNEIAWYENDGNLNFTKHTIDTDTKGAYYATPADADGDGNIDIFTASRKDATIALFLNDGSQNFTKKVLTSEALGARTVLATDLDRDGDMDAVASSVNTDTVFWFENVGNAEFEIHEVDNDANGAYGLFLTDMDFDGDTDVLSASKISGEVAIDWQINTQTATVAKGDTLLIDASVLQAVDAEDGPADLTYTLAAIPERGEIQLDGAALTVDDTFTQADVDAGRVTYVHGGSNQSANSLTYLLGDGGEDNVHPLEGTLVITVK